MPHTIRPLTPDDASAFQSLRLAALMEAPTAFGSQPCRRPRHEHAALLVDGELHDDLHFSLRLDGASSAD